MRALVARAGVSLATPYNMFGSKLAVILAVLEDVQKFEDRFAARCATGPLDRIFTALDVALEGYLDDRCFYKSLWLAAFDADAEIQPEILNPCRGGFWLQLIEDANARGILESSIEPTMLQFQFDLVLKSGLFGWVTGQIDDAKLRPAMAYSFALILRGAATAVGQKQLRERVRQHQAALMICFAERPVSDASIALGAP